MMQASGVHLRVGLMILGGIALLVGLIWFLAGSQISPWHAVRDLLQRVGAGPGGRRGRQVSWRNDRPGDRYRSDQRRIRRQAADPARAQHLSPGVRALCGRYQEGRPDAGHQRGRVAWPADPPGIAGDHRAELPGAGFRRSGALPGAGRAVAAEGDIHPLDAEYVRPGAGCGAAGAGEAEAGWTSTRWPRS